MGDAKQACCLGNGNAMVEDFVSLLDLGAFDDFINIQPYFLVDVGKVLYCGISCPVEFFMPSLLEHCPDIFQVICYFWAVFSPKL